MDESGGRGRRAVEAGEGARGGGGECKYDGPQKKGLDTFAAGSRGGGGLTGADL